MRHIITTILFMGLTVGTTNHQDRGWKGIVPLSSTRAEVENKLGKAINKSNNSYETDSENISIHYTKAPCTSGSGWNVPSDTVIYIFVHPKIKSPVSDLTIDLGKYRKEDDKLPDVYIFRNDEEGATIEVVQGKVVGYYYGPSSRDQHQRCKR